MLRLEHKSQWNMQNYMKRTEKNAELYAKVDSMIKEAESKTDNTEFLQKISVYENIDPEVFGKENKPKEKKKEKKKIDKRTLGMLCIIIALVAILTIIGVVIYYETK